MGIKHFYTWIKNEFPEAFLNNYPKIDHLLIDMNGIIHEACQIIYKYGPYKNKRLLGPPAQPDITYVFLKIRQMLNKILYKIKPRKSVFLAIDGVAPQSKQNQQRQRRFKAVYDNKDNLFDSNCITAGTHFMNEISDYLKYNYTLECTANTTLNIYISDSKDPGEGEHKLMNFIRKGLKNDKYCIVGMDADFIMISLLIEKNIFILRSQDIIDIDFIKNILSKRIPIKDFIIIGFMMGNDFLPNIPSLEIIDNALELLMLLYSEPLIDESNNIILKHIKNLLRKVSDYEEDIMKAREKQNRYRDSLWNNDIDKYRNSYMTKHFSDKNIKNILEEYLKGFQWIFYYYNTGEPISWKWYYPFHYVPHARILSEHVPEQINFNFEKSSPSSIDEQLLRVLPPNSKAFIKPELYHFFDNLSTNFKLDFSGKKYDWEAVVIVDFIEINI